MIQMDAESSSRTAMVLLVAKEETQPARPVLATHCAGLRHQHDGLHRSTIALSGSVQSPLSGAIASGSSMLPSGSDALALHSHWGPMIGQRSAGWSASAAPCSWLPLAAACSPLSILVRPYLHKMRTSTRCVLSWKERAWVGPG